METTKINHFIEYLPATLILSYYFIHNILLVLIGIVLSLYLININFISSFIGSINKTLVIKKTNIELNKNYKGTKTNSINVEPNKDDKKLTLVETIEELGFIPSIDKNEESNAA
tara:strand:+ start:219 stop:560 length:342 start_codon:yes stop_codon:yes gene_type:complete